MSHFKNRSLQEVQAEESKLFSEGYWDAAKVEEKDYIRDSVFDLTQGITDHLWEIYRADEEIDSEAILYVCSLIGQIRLKLGLPSGYYLKNAA